MSYISTEDVRAKRIKINPPANNKNVSSPNHLTLIFK